MGEHFSHLTKTKRIQLDAFVRAGMKPAQIAIELGVHRSTIYRELKRATYEHLNSDYTTETRYNPDEADRLYRENLKAKGPAIKLGTDYELADYLVTKIRDERYSPEAAIGEAVVAGWPFKVRICTSTVYNYIRDEVFGDDLTPEMLPQQGKRQPAKKDVDHTPARPPAGKSIEERPQIVDTRTTFGHWEMDCIESCEGVKDVWLMMTERMTRHEIIIPMKDQTSASVVRALNGIERKLGALLSTASRPTPRASSESGAARASAPRSTTATPGRPTSAAATSGKTGWPAGSSRRAPTSAKCPGTRSSESRTGSTSTPAECSVFTAPSTYSGSRSWPCWPTEKFFSHFFAFSLDKGVSFLQSCSKDDLFKVGRRMLAQRAGKVRRKFLAFVNVAAYRTAPCGLPGRRLLLRLRFDVGLIVGIGSRGDVGKHFHVVHSRDKQHMAAQVDGLLHRGADVGVSPSCNVVEAVGTAPTVRET